MKNVKIALTLSLMTSLGLIAQNTTVDLEKFTELKAFDRVNVTLVKSTENKAIVSGDDQSEVEFSNDDGMLKIRMELDEFLAGNETNVELHYTEALSLVDSNEGAEITGTEALDNNYITLRAQEGAKIKVTVDTRNLESKAVSGGKIWVSGTSPNQEANVRSGGEYHAEDLMAQQTEVTVFAGGKAKVNSKEYVEANVTAGGTIEIYGKPEKVDEDKTFGGSIVIKD